MPAIIECCGPGPAAAARASERAIKFGATALLSFGVAGALDPLLPTGTLIVATEIHRHNGKTLPCDTAWRMRCAQALDAARQGAIYGSDTAISTADRKRALFDATGAAAVDMESHAVAAAATSARIPFLAVRAIADAARQSVPAHLVDCIDDRGRPRPLAIVAALLRHPSEVFMLPSANRAYRAALAALARAASAGGEALRKV